MTLVQNVLVALPWILIIVSVVLVSLGLSWRHLTDSDTVNGAFVLAGIILAGLAFVVGCIRDIPQLAKTHKAQMAHQSPPDNARLPFVTV